MPEPKPASRVVAKLAGCCLLAGVLAAALMFPLAGGVGLLSNRASDIVANGSAQLLEGDVPQVTTMVDTAGNPIAWLYSQRRFEVPTDQIANTMKLAIVSIEAPTPERPYHVYLLRRERHPEPKSPGAS